MFNVMRRECGLDAEFWDVLVDSFPTEEEAEQVANDLNNRSSEMFWVDYGAQ